ncbi:MAG TPA: Na+/H+ antiporter NhaA [Candidatus Limnocylindria bacterium]|nr:Na+/H+ antiporter NhaA [Candidatus Limnocylindria bacterium]
MTQDTLPVDRILAPFREFARNSAASGILLIAAAVVALAWANSPFALSYTELWETRLTIGFGGTALTKSLHDWINDGLMAVFFFVVGLELKREVLIGELGSIRRALLPITAAIGGAIVPAVLFLAIVGPGDAGRGWAIPMATDIAFALGVLALLGDRIPIGLRVFMAALAIVDDLIAVLVIGIFYTSDVSVPGLAASAACLGLLVGANVLGVRRPVVYGLLGLATWFAVLQSGIHPTVAGVLVALTIPARTKLDAAAFAAKAGEIVSAFAEREADTTPVKAEDHHSELWELEEISERAQAPMLRFEHALQPWVAFVVVPIFALANAGIAIGADIGSLMGDPLVLGVAVGLVVGKQVGITVAVLLALRFGLASLPHGVTLAHVYGAAWLGGIGFTMSIFIADLAFADASRLALAKLGVLVASAIAGAGGYVVLRRATRAATARPAPGPPVRA